MKDFHLFKNFTNAYYMPSTMWDGAGITANMAEWLAPAVMDLPCRVRKRDTNE